MKDDARITKLRLAADYLEFQIYQQINTYENLEQLKKIQRKLTKIYRENGYTF
jgi:hypothetical protein